MSYEGAIQELAEAAAEMLDAHEEHKPCGRCFRVECADEPEGKLRQLRKEWAERRRQSRSWLQEALLSYESAVRMRAG